MRSTVQVQVQEKEKEEDKENERVNNGLLRKSRRIPFIAAIFRRLFIRSQRNCRPMGLFSSDPLTAKLKEVFGFPKFRPLQREIIEETLAGKDALAILPTGGGKSLCYQLPALTRPGLTLVVSPLIALMKDQVDGLLENGIKAAYLNSALNEEESKDTWRQLYRGEIKILYLSPERLMVEGMFETLAQLNLEFVAVDEAHCISSWGHDFRPEYRALKGLRDRFPNVPVLALTASATERVRADILEMLGMSSARTFIASFNRPSLSYRIIPRLSPMKQIVEILADHKGESGIIYCLSRARTESVAEELVKKGIKATAYHAGLSGSERDERQDQFVQDKIQVMVATIAFGMGVDKPDVRFVIHHDLPKNIESYYQETGRAGRDGLPSECVLLYSSGDAAKLRQFIEQASDQTEREVAGRQLTQLLQFAEGSECRRVSLLRYFGEQYKGDDGRPTLACGACDNCLTPRQEVDATEIAQKLISCILRISKHSGFSVGLAHVVDVLMGAQHEKIRRWGHDSLSTYGVGKGRSKQEWLYYGRELMSCGLVWANPERFNVLEVTGEGMSVLKERRSVTLRAPLVTSGLTAEKKREQKKQLGAIEYDTDLFEKLRHWRSGVAREKGLPAYMVFSDATLQQIAAMRPSSRSGLETISGIGEKKLALYGEAVLAVVGG
jgi:ATP-dependent DNA helicase RecQ